MASRPALFILTLLFGFLAGGVGGGIVGYLTASQTGQQFWNDTTQQTETRTIVEESATIDVVKNANPSVVSIVITKELQQRRGGVRPPAFSNPFFDQFFGQQQSDENTEDESQEVEVGEGSGFVISEDGMILTNRHVVQDTDANYTVVFDSGESYDAKVLARDQLTDLAVLKIDATGLTPLPLGDSDSAVQGQAVIAIGNTLGDYPNTATKGIISGLSRNLGGNYVGLIQTDAAINRGNSGGPLLNMSGEVIGVNTAVDRREDGDAIGFAIPINEAKVAIESVKLHGKILRPALGIRYVPIDEDVAKLNSLPYTYGAYVQGGNAQTFGVIPGSAADKAGIVEGDILLEINGTQIDTEHLLPVLLKAYTIGDTIQVKLYHDGAEKTVDVTLEALPETNAATTSDEEAQ